MKRYLLLALTALMIATGTILTAKNSQNFKTSTLETPTKTITLSAVGDIMLSREVANRIARADDFAYPFTATADITKKADITFGNLETAVLHGRKIGIEMVFRSDPETLEGLQLGGYDIVSLANNHSYNFGEDGIKKTMQHLFDKDIAHCGSGNTDREAYAPTIMEVKGVSIAFLCYNDTDVVPNYTFATAAKAGTAEMLLDRMKASVLQIKDSADIIVVSMHSGTEYARHPNKRQTAFARAAVDAGAHIVLGHHPHVLQPIEHYKQGVIFYSLGNFIFDQFGTRQNQSVIADIAITIPSKEISYSFTPVKITDFSRPIPVEDEAESQQILEQLHF